MQFKELSNMGFIIYENNNKFVLQKISVPNNTQTLSCQEFMTYNDAFNFAKSFIAEKNITYQAIIRYSRGLGVEYYSLPNIIAKDEIEAKTIALEKSELLKNPKVKVAEVKIKFQN